MKGMKDKKKGNGLIDLRIVDQLPLPSVHG
jgi:hypothetical protein